MVGQTTLERFSSGGTAKNHKEVIYMLTTLRFMPIPVSQEFGSSGLTLVGVYPEHCRRIAIAAL